MIKGLLIGVSLAGLAVTGSMVVVNAHQVSGDVSSQIAALTELQTISSSVSELKAPTIKDPQWLEAQLAAEKAATAATQQQALPAAGARIVTYSVASWGTISASLPEFRQQVSATLKDGRGWSRMGVSFQEVASGGQFILVLSEANELARRYSPGCSAEYSCRVGQYVIINQDRWVGATPSWNSAGGSIRDYRHMVVNHETGHWLGHGHEGVCVGGLAPVMQQQSISLNGCSFNPWPLAAELYSPQLGIAR